LTVKIKAQGLLNAAKWIEEEFGLDALERILQACSPQVRERCATAIAINWHPMQEFVEFLTMAEQALGSGSGRLAERIGEQGARNNLKGALIRMAFWVSKPDFLMKRVAGLWRQFNDEGEMVILHADHDVRRFEVTGVSTPNWLFCCTITGWGTVTTQAAGIVNPVARHVQCRARGASRCLWEVTTPVSEAPGR
jgi:hypothetical protein